MKIIFVRFSSLGDIVLTTGVMNYLNRRMPEAEIDIMTYRQYMPLFDNLPFVHNVVDYEKSRGIKEYFYLVQNELEEHDHIFDLHGKLRSKFLKYHAQASYHCYKKDSRARRAYVKSRKTDPRLELHVVQKYFEPVAQAFDIEMPGLEELRPVLIRHAEKRDKHVLIHPFASRATKAYPYAGELAEILLSKGYTPVFAGVGKAPNIKGAVDKTGNLPLDEFLDTAASCEAVISTDSGPMHIGTALNKPTVGIFGSTTKHFGFYPSFEGCAVLENNDVQCRPCDVHGLEKCPKGHFDCMNTLKPEQAAELLESLI